MARSGKQQMRGGVEIVLGDALDLYDLWPSPVVIVSDGPYGLGLPGDLATPGELPGWYEPHIQAWSEHATPLTTLWFWSTEIGWATVHPVLAKHGWSYEKACTWDKGIAHVAGNTNTKTLRRLPTVTELCVRYTKPPTFRANGREMSTQEWLRHEWLRTGLLLADANRACGVRNAATRKYLTKCHRWYSPPTEVFERLVAYANRHGSPAGRPFFSTDGEQPLTESQWSDMRAKFHCEPGLTNVWHGPSVRGSERIKNGTKAAHANQKPLSLIELTIRLCSDAGDIVWEPFGGLCTAAVASYRLGRQCYSAEIDPCVYDLAARRLLDCGETAG